MENRELGLILVIDDDPDATELFEEAIKAEYPSLDVKIFNESSKGLRYAILYKPDLIVCDLMMPDPDGYDICEILSSQIETKNIPILIITAVNDEDSRNRCFAIGASDYLLKPFRLDEFYQSIKDLLREKRLGLFDK